MRIADINSFSVPPSWWPRPRWWNRKWRQPQSWMTSSKMEITPFKMPPGSGSCASATYIGELTPYTTLVSFYISLLAYLLVYYSYVLSLVRICIARFPAPKMNKHGDTGNTFWTHLPELKCFVCQSLLITELFMSVLIEYFDLIFHIRETK